MIAVAEPAAERGAAYPGDDLRAGAKPQQPAHAKRIHAMRSRGLAPRIAVWVVDGWSVMDDREEQFGEWSIVVPDDVPLAMLNFRCLAGLPVLIQARDRERVHDIAEQVFRFQPGQLWGYPENEETLTYFAPRAA